MKGPRSVQSNRDLQVVRLSIRRGLAMLFVAILSWASTGGGSATVSLPAAVEAMALRDGTVITIGVAADLSGPVEFLGWRQANAVQLAVDQINAAGGVEIGGLTHTLDLVTADSACEPTQAVTAADALLDAGVVAVVGHSCSGASLAAQGIYSEARVPMISPSSTAVSLTEQGYTTTFRVIPRDDAQAILMATYFRQWLRMDAVALIDWIGFEWSTDAFADTFTGLGGTITSRHTVASTDSYTATLTAIQPEDPDAVFYAEVDGGNAGFLSSIAHNLGMSVIGWDTIWLDTANPGDYAAAAGAAAEGDYAGLNGRRTDDMPGYADFNDAYQAAGFSNYGDEARMQGAFAYDAAKIIVAAIENADSADPMDIRDSIAVTAQYPGVVGTYTGFDARGDVIPQWSWLERYQNGQWVALHRYPVFLPLVLNKFP